ncbi:hypothetical protein [Roseibium sp. M-1]
MNDILSEPALPAVWTGGTAKDIGVVLLDALSAILDADFLFLRVVGHGDYSDVLLERYDERSVGCVSALIDDLIETVETNASDWPRYADLDCSQYPVKGATEKLGIHGRVGVLVAGSMASSFSSDEDRIVLHIAVSQAAIAADEALWFRADTRALAAGELHNVIDAIPEMAWSTEPDGSADFFKEHFLAYLGIITERAAGRTAAPRSDDSDLLQSVWEWLLASGALGETEARLIRWNRQSRWCLFRANPVLGDDGTVSRSIVEAYQGRIWEEHNSSGGAFFGFALPVNR